MKEQSKVYSITDEEFAEFVKNSYSISDLMRKLKLDITGHEARNKCKMRIDELNLSVSHFTRNGLEKENKSRKAIPSKIIFTENSKISRAAAKRRIIRDNLIPYQCRDCGNKGEWNNKPITLQLEHKNGISNDHRLENLCFLCPNCHSQTNTYAGKNAKIAVSKDIEEEREKRGYSVRLDKCECGKFKLIESKTCEQCYHILERIVERPNRDKLKELIRINPFVKIANLYGVSDKAIVKWCKYYSLPYKAREIKNISDEDWNNI